MLGRPGRLLSSPSRSAGVSYGEIFANNFYLALASANFTLVSRLKRAAWLGTPTAGPITVRLLVCGGFTSAYIGFSGTGAAFTATPTQLFVNGAADNNTGITAPVLTDPVTLTWNGTDDLCVSFNSGSRTYGYNDAAGATADAYYKAGSGDASTVAKTGYTTAAGAVYYVEAAIVSGVSPAILTGTRKIVFDGNSLTAGVGASLYPYPTQIPFYYRYKTLTLVNLGVPSATTAQRMAANSTLAHYEAGAVAVLWEITNDLYFGGTANDAVDRFWSWCDQVRGQGYKVVAVTPLPRSGTSTPGTFETDRQTVLTRMRAEWTSHADALSDVAANTTIGDAGDELNTTYYDPDKVHMKNRGYGVVASVIGATLKTI